MKQLLAGLAAGLLGLAPPANAAPSATTAAGPVTLPFAPPLNAPLHYSSTVTRGDGPSALTVRSMEELRFSRESGGGYDLRWVTTSIDVAAAPVVKKFMDRLFGLAVGQPIDIRVSAEGFPLSVENTAAARALTDRMADSLANAFDDEFPALPPALRTGLKGMMSGLIAQQHQMSDAAFADQLLQEPRLLLRNIGPMRVGMPELVEAQIDSPIGGGKLRTAGQVELVSIEAGKSARVRISSATNPDDVAKLVSAMMQSMLAGFTGDIQAQDKLTAELKPLTGMSFTDELVVDINLPSGLARHAEYRKIVAVPGKPARTETHIYDLIDAVP